MSCRATILACFSPFRREAVAEKGREAEGKGGGIEREGERGGKEGASERQKKDKKWHDGN